MKTRFGSVEDQQGQNKQSQKLENSSVFSTQHSVIQKLFKLLGHQEPNNAIITSGINTMIHNSHIFDCMNKMDTLRVVS